MIQDKTLSNEQIIEYITEGCTVKKILDNGDYSETRHKCMNRIYSALEKTLESVKAIYSPPKECFSNNEFKYGHDNQWSNFIKDVRYL